MEKKYDLHQKRFPEMEHYSIAPHYSKVEVREGYVSPCTVDELLDMENSQIVEKINTFEAKPGWDEPAIEGLLSTLQQAVIERPSKFLDDWKVLLSLEIGVLANIMSGFEIAGKDKKSLNWSALLDFYDAVTGADRFTFPKDANWTAEYQFIYYFVNLIEKACDKEHHFPKEFFNTIRDKLLILLDYAKNAKTTTQQFQEIDIQALNSFQGNIFSALISISWLNKYVFECNEWDCLTKTKLTDILTTPTLYSAEFAFSFGKSYPCLLAFDPNWFEEYKSSIFITQDNQLWQSNFLGYLHSTQIYLEIYKYFEKRGDYKKGLNELSSHYAKKKILEHILIAFMQENKKYESDTLLYQVIHRNEAPIFENIISYFYYNSAKLKEKNQDDLIKKIWKDILNLISCDDAIKSDCLKFVSSISNLDDTSVDLIKKSLKSKNREDFFFVKGLLMHTDNSLQYVGEIIKDGLTQNYIIQYHNDEIQKIIKCLFENHATKDLAENICTLYLKNGYTFLQDIQKQFASSMYNP